MDIINHASGWFANNEELVLQYIVNAASALVIIVVGFIVAGIIASSIERVMNKRKVDNTISSFTGSMVKYLLIAFVIIAALSRVGVQTASFVAVLGAAGLAIGLALQGSLSNFAAGVLIVGFRPFRAGDYVEMAGTAGTVKSVQILTTTLTTPDNKEVIVPNSSVFGGAITNYSRHEKRRLDLIIGVSYKADLKQTKAVIQAVLDNEPRILKDEPITLGVLELANSSVNFAVRPWVKTSDFWPVRYDLLEAIKNALDEAGIEIPFPQMDVHIDRNA
ncbi:small-conductance mechanosensitive channel MscS [Celerinatantimonas diazotrophica]|uniref:Small-conductance mechanosensitive channel n=1 Tax=Celerinatantimonas diazotrophica TaxID=412034 RepID=A0A4R1J7I5_9GAMM|nr:small-conductance mechanosensitive channel MscS [Celerinatantimonas diazotrophica]TCK46383.1 small conductance mechanosensitive channel [Celerinatantimonas diazotrophica]CAG9295243.1 Small-conductance mechanosensitive channel [Celerinatantimonas diazotrophica]